MLHGAVLMMLRDSIWMSNEFVVQIGRDVSYKRHGDADHW